MPNLWIIFTTGLLTGGLTCVAVQGGLLATSMVGIRYSVFGRFLGTLSFLVSKLAAYVVLGLVLGGAGAVLQFTPVTRAIIQGVVAVYMLGVGLSMLEVHPIFRYFIISTPRFLNKIIRNQSKSSEWFGPALLGLMTVFIPCGTTQAMMALAVGSGKPLSGAVIMGTFVLGTIPVFAVVGMAAAKLGENFRKIAAWSVVGVALWSMNAALVLGGSPISAQKAWAGVECIISYCGPTVAGVATNLVNVEIRSNGYKLDNPVIKAGSDITLKLENTTGNGCQQVFTLPKLGLNKIVPMGQKGVLAFKAPDKPGTLDFSCGMGMYRGQFTVVN